MVVEVSYMTWTEDGLLRHVVYLGEREDKPARQVVRDLKQYGLDLPTHVVGKEGYGTLIWKRPTLSAVVRILEPSSPLDFDVKRESARAAALDQFLALARSSSFRSFGTYPTRDDLHERD